MATELILYGGQVDTQAFTKKVRDNIKQARSHRKQYEPEWELNMAFASGKHWIVYDRKARSLRRIQDVDPRYRNKELYTSDLINEYRTTVLGELGSDDDRPELLTINNDVTSEEFATQVNRALQYGWDNEWDGDTVLAEADRICVDMGTAAIRCKYDPAIGPVRQDNVPHIDGKPEFNIGKVADAYSRGEQIQMLPIRGQICWEALTPFNMLTPPGVTHEKKFPWECVITPVTIDAAKQVGARYGLDLSELKEDGDIRSTMGLSTDSPTGGNTMATGDPRSTRLRDHVWLFTYYERPTQQFPKGRVLTFVSNNMQLIGYEEQLPYVGPDGVYRSGMAYFHWWRVTGRFWSRSLVGALQDAQFTMDKRRTQMNEIIDRGMPFVFIQKNSNAKKRTFLPFEEVEIDPNEKQPQAIQGIGPGPWMSQEVELIRSDAEHASGVKSTSLGENPANVTTYSQLALIREADSTKRQPIMQERKQAIGRLVENSVYDMRNFWGSEKQIILSGEEGKVESFIFNSTKIPTEYIVKIARGTPKPRSQAAELQKIQDIAQYSLNSQQPLSVNWYYESLEHGQPMPLPDQPSNDQYDKAVLENHFMAQGAQVPVTYYDPPDIHIPVHRSAQIKAELIGDVGLWQRIEAHVQQHKLVAMQNSAQNAETVGPPTMGQGMNPQDAAGITGAKAVPQPPTETDNSGSANNGSSSQS